MSAQHCSDYIPDYGMRRLLYKYVTIPVTRALLCGQSGIDCEIAIQRAFGWHAGVLLCSNSQLVIIMLTMHSSCAADLSA
jgi:hypothetical protein